MKNQDSNNQAGVLASQNKIEIKAEGPLIFPGCDFEQEGGISPTHRRPGVDSMTAEDFPQELERKWLKFLPAKLERLSLREKHTLQQRMTETVEGAFKRLAKKLNQIPDLKFKNENNTICFKWGYYDAQDTISVWGKACLECQTVSLPSVLIFAPKEIIRALAVHEALHIIYSALAPTGLKTFPISRAVEEDYPQQQQAEQWVRDMTKKCGFVEEYLESWLVALDGGEEGWKERYYFFKKKRHLIA